MQRLRFAIGLLTSLACMGCYQSHGAIEPDASTAEPTCEDLAAAMQCPLEEGVCAGISPRCVGGEAVCAYGPGYEADERRCDGNDNDCDGMVDESCDCLEGNTRPCGDEESACPERQRCVDGLWGACMGRTGPAPESCNGVDDDCDGSTDEDVGTLGCPLTRGVCAGARAACEGASGFARCDASTYGLAYEPEEWGCDGLDNDCDGDTDEQCGCVDGATLRCGIEVGACEFGMQTCEVGRWGSCEGGIVAVRETCNGIDDDCDGRTDESLGGPSCGVSNGVCADAVAMCLGTAGWGGCGPASFGPHYVADEDGAARPEHCDVLDNDCDGVADEGCDEGTPLITGPYDIVAPSIYGQLLVYLSNDSGNFDVYGHRVDLGHTFRITNTPEDEHAPTVSGSIVVYTRGEGAARRAYWYDLGTGAESALSTRLSDHPTTKEGHTIVFSEYDGTQWDLILWGPYSRDPLVATPTFLHQPVGLPGNQYAASVTYGSHGAWATYFSDETGTVRAHLSEFSESLIYGVPVGGPLPNASDPVRNFAGPCWTDGRNVRSPSPADTDDWDVYCTMLRPISARTAEIPWASGPGAQIVDSQHAWVGFSDHSLGNWNVGIGRDGGEGVLLTRHPAEQRHVVSSHDILVWQDARSGTWDLYTTRRTPTGSSAWWRPVFRVRIRDAGASSTFDVNGDGVVDAGDQYVEIQVPHAVGGARVLVDGVVRHVFAPGTLVREARVVIFAGGGAFRGHFGGADVVRASTGSLGLTSAPATISFEWPGGGEAARETLPTTGLTPGWGW